MNPTLNPVALALLIPAAQFSGIAHAQSPQAPKDWIIHDDATYTPVIDDLSRHLDAARKAFDAQDAK